MPAIASDRLPPFFKSTWEPANPVSFSVEMFLPGATWGCRVALVAVRESGFKVGYYFFPMQHLEMALSQRHPGSAFNVVPDILRRNLFELMTGGIYAMARKRINFIKRLGIMKKDLESEEKKLLAGMPGHVLDVVGGKPLLLFKKLLEESHFGDMSVFEMMTEGVPLTGVEPESELFDKNLSQLL